MTDEQMKVLKDLEISYMRADSQVPFLVNEIIHLHKALKVAKDYIDECNEMLDKIKELFGIDTEKEGPLPSTNDLI